MKKLFASLARWWRGLLVINPCPECGRGACDGWALEDWDVTTREKYVKEWRNRCPAGHEWKDPK